MVEEANAQLVLQHMILEKLNELLQLKENRKKNNCSTLFNRKGIVLTDEFETEIKQQKEHREQQQVQKERNHQLQALKKNVKAVIEAQWEEVKRDHKKAVERWQTEYKMLETHDIYKKEWPKKPTRPL